MFFVIETNKRVSIERRFKNLWKTIYLKNVSSKGIYETCTASGIKYDRIISI